MATDLRNLPEMNFVQVYDYVVVSTRKYRHIVLKGTNYKKLLPVPLRRECQEVGMQKPRKRKVSQGECFTFDEEDAIPSCDRVLTYL